MADHECVQMISFTDLVNILSGQSLISPINFKGWNSTVQDQLTQNTLLNAIYNIKVSFIPQSLFIYRRQNH